jgi:cathepsin F
MRFVLFALLAASVFAVDSNVEKEFQRFMVKHSKTYTVGSPDYADRLRNFANNWQRAQLLTNQQQSAVFSVSDNKFADMHPDEFKAKILMNTGKFGAPKFSADKYAPLSDAAAAIPDSFDWRTKKAVTAVRDQGSVGTCWAFSTAQNIEGQYALKYGKLEQMSVEQLVECDASTSTKLGEADCGMFGGWPNLAFEYLIKAGGIRSEANYPYCLGFSDNCWPCMASGYSPSLCGDHSDLYCNATSTKGQAPGGYCSNTNDIEVKLTDWKAISSNETEIAQQLVNIGPLSVLMNAGPLQLYSKGVYNPGSASACDPTDLDHAVLLVGYGTENGVDFWIVKNSWGSTWGEQGYFRIVRGQGACGINTAVTTSVIA